MARQLRINYPGAFYHVTSRGNEQKAVFKSKRDREKFLEYLLCSVRKLESNSRSANQRYHMQSAGFRKPLQRIKK